MKATQQKAPEIKKSIFGEKVGDKIMFSSHHPKNINNAIHLSSLGISFDKLYTVESIDIDSKAVITNDKGSKNRLCNTRSHHEIIVSAPEPKPEFQPVTLTLETLDDVAKIAHLLGSVPGGDLPGEKEAWQVLRDVAKASGKYIPNHYSTTINCRA